MSSYNPNIPNPTDLLSISQGQLKGNFNKANSSFGTDHYEFADLTSNNGLHKKTTWVDQSASVPLSVAGAVVGYGNTISGVTMPYYKRDGLATVYPLSPIKAYATFTLTGAVTPYFAVLNDSFNVATVQINGPNQTPQITLTNPMRTANYGVLALATGFAFGVFPGPITYSITSSSVFNLIQFSSTNTATITVIALET